MRALAILVAVSGCNALWGIGNTEIWDARVFDAPIDTPVDACGPVGPDFDHDGIVDDCDLCPQDPRPTGDSDGDGIGDECDPRPTEKDTRVMFAGFEGSDLIGWHVVSGSWMAGGGGLAQANSSGTARIDLPSGVVGSVYVDTKLYVASTGSAPYAGVCGDVSAPDYDCCDADATSPVSIYARSATSQVATAFGGSIAPGDELLLHMTTGASSFGCTLAGGAVMANAMLANAPAAGIVVLHTRDMVVIYRYVFVVKLGQ